MDKYMSNCVRSINIKRWMITLETENTFADQYSTNRGKFLHEANAQMYFTSSVLVP